MEGALPFMASRRAVILTPSRSSHPTQLLSRQQSAPISPLAATLMNLPASVANKELTRSLSLLAATLTKNRGWGPPPCDVSAFNPSSSLHLPFHALTNCLFHKSFLLTFMHRMGGVGGASLSSSLASNFQSLNSASPQISFPPSHPLESPRCIANCACTHRNEARA